MCWRASQCNAHQKFFLSEAIPVTNVEQRIAHETESTENSHVFFFCRFQIKDITVSLPRLGRRVPPVVIRRQREFLAYFPISVNGGRNSTGKLRAAACGEQILIRNAGRPLAAERATI
jgi:hypothetical protein